jgi:hypothetical protein
MIEISGTIQDPGKFRIDSVHIDGRARAMLVCNPCAHYAYHVSSRKVAAIVGARFEALDLAEVLALAAIHECPAIVTEYMKRKGA